MSKHTKGPWIAVGSRVEHPEFTIPDICDCDPEVMYQGGRDYEEMAANARLIAAAPDMLDALNKIAMLLNDYGAAGAAESEAIARAAIEQATGGGA